MVLIYHILVLQGTKCASVFILDQYALTASSASGTLLEADGVFNDRNAALIACWVSAIIVERSGCICNVTSAVWVV